MPLDPDSAALLRRILQEQRIASLGTLADGEPHVSMVPFATLPRGAGFVIHVSRLAAHTKQMLAHPGVSVLVVAREDPGVAPQATPRVTVQGEATPCDPEDPRYGEARSAYLERFPEGEQLFGFGDFSLFVIAPRLVRFVGGFAQAKSLTPEGFAAAMGGGARG